MKKEKRKKDKKKLRPNGRKNEVKNEEKEERQKERKNEQKEPSLHQASAKLPPSLHQAWPSYSQPHPGLAKPRLQEVYIYDLRFPRSCGLQDVQFLDFHDSQNLEILSSYRA